MDFKHSKGKWIAWLCIAFGLAIVIYSTMRFIVGTGAILIFMVGLPVIAYGVLMLHALRKVKP